MSKASDFIDLSFREVEKLNEESASRDTGMPAEAKRIPSARQPEPQQARPQTQNTKPRKSQTAAKPRASTAANEDWELDCDVCRSKGINKVKRLYKSTSDIIITLP